MQSPKWPNTLRIKVIYLLSVCQKLLLLAQKENKMKKDFVTAVYDRKKEVTKTGRDKVEIRIYFSKQEEYLIL